MVPFSKVLSQKLSHQSGCKPMKLNGSFLTTELLGNGILKN